MKLIKIENKIYKVSNKTFNKLKDAEENWDYTSWPNENLDKISLQILNGEEYGVRYLGEIEFQHSYLSF